MADPRVLLLGCVKRKRMSAHAAKDLYCSPLWAARRAYAEERADRWFVVSALHGLVDPAALVEPYDLALDSLSGAERRIWGEAVVAALERRLGSVAGVTIEIHAGGLYRRALEPALLVRGARFESPTATIAGVGRQIAWYSAQSASAARRRVATDQEVSEAIAALDGSPTIVRADDWPGSADGINEPGLYSWWVDSGGAAMLSAGLGFTIRPDRIYAGLTGATKWPSGRTGKNTLRKRIGGNHIRGRIHGSTFRLTLAAILRDQLDLTVANPKALTPSAEQTLTAWMGDHLSVAVHAFPAEPLGDLEHRVLARLDPSLNLDGMPTTPIRVRLTELRRALSQPATTRLSAEIGGGPHGYYSVKSDGNRLTWHGPPTNRQGKAPNVVIHPSADAWREFWRTLDRLHVWDWNSRYDIPDVLDGTHWSLEAFHAGRHVKAAGDNGYPDSPGPDPSKVFRDFCKAVSQLADGRTFA